MTVTVPATPTERDETWVWDAFRELRVDGLAIHRTLVDDMIAGAFFDPPGATLEVGGGDGHLWRVGGDALVERALAAGDVTITDADPALVSRSFEQLRRPGFCVKEGDLARLPFADGAFVRVIAVHVLHWCVAPGGVARALAELARTMSPRARALVVTVDEAVHMHELYELLDNARRALERAGVAMTLSIPRCSPRVLPFCAGNAAGLLARAFGSVERRNCRYAHVLDAVHPTLGMPADELVVRYVQTLPFVVEGVARGEVPSAFFDEIAKLVRDEVRANGALRFSRCDVIYDLREPR